MKINKILLLISVGMTLPCLGLSPVDSVAQVKDALLKAKTSHPKYFTAGIIGGATVGVTLAALCAKSVLGKKADLHDMDFESFNTPDQAINAVVQAAPVKKIQPAQKRVVSQVVHSEPVVSLTPGLDKIIDTARKSLHELKADKVHGGEIMSIYWTPEVQADVEKLNPKAQQALHKACLDYDCNIMTQAAACERAHQLRQEGYEVDKFGFARKDGDIISIRSKVQDGARLVKVFNQCKRQIIK